MRFTINVLFGVCFVPCLKAAKTNNSLKIYPKPVGKMDRKLICSWKPTHWEDCYEIQKIVQNHEAKKEEVEIRSFNLL
ncbi:CLUMA_CG002741, isoform A [Clunio marinus]|uniref:CLUMA_CG002741, isoform A n=1 Tax=Clunio marinus TaxID=568069 RepID=A0A1J1HLM4_9DIPT|nr:CLUMA_CG002741, isoform A [Clunio marinus]